LPARLKVLRRMLDLFICLRGTSTTRLKIPPLVPSHGQLKTLTPVAIPPLAPPFCHRHSHTSNYPTTVLQNRRPLNLRRLRLLVPSPIFRGRAAARGPRPDCPAGDDPAFKRYPSCAGSSPLLYALRLLSARPVLSARALRTPIERSSHPVHFQLLGACAIAEEPAVLEILCIDPGVSSVSLRAFSERFCGQCRPRRIWFADLRHPDLFSVGARCFATFSRTAMIFSS